jgi:hypothetical protein
MLPIQLSALDNGILQDYSCCTRYMVIERRLGCPLVMHNVSLKKPSSSYECRTILTAGKSNYVVDGIGFMISAPTGFGISPPSFPGRENSKGVCKIIQPTRDVISGKKRVIVFSAA